MSNYMYIQLTVEGRKGDLTKDISRIDKIYRSEINDLDKKELIKANIKNMLNKINIVIKVNIEVSTYIDNLKEKSIKLNYEDVNGELAADFIEAKIETIYEKLMQAFKDWYI